MVVWHISKPAIGLPRLGCRGLPSPAGLVSEGGFERGKKAVMPMCGLGLIPWGGEGDSCGIQGLRQK